MSIIFAAYYRSIMELDDQT